MHPQKGKGTEYHYVTLKIQATKNTLQDFDQV